MFMLLLILLSFVAILIAAVVAVIKPPSRMRKYVLGVVLVVALVFS